MAGSQQREKIKTYGFAFMLPVLLALLAFWAMGVYPFGDKTLLIMDMQSEYIDYLSQLNETVRSSGSLLRSWNMGMGLNMLGLIAFYCSSPVNIIILLLPLSVITESVFVVTLLKFGLAGLLFSVYARNTFAEAGQAAHVVFALCYALCAYNIVYSSNIMWLDGVAFLPLVLLGAENILQKGGYKIFILSLVYVFATSYYIGYMVGIFSFIYFTARFFTKRSDFKKYFGMLLRFAACAALAAGFCAFLLLPAFLNLKNGQNELWQIKIEPELRYTFTQMAAKLLPGTYDSMTNAGLPNIYCTILCVFLCALFFFTKAVPLREKLIFGGVLAFLFISFSSGFIDLAWHAFEPPTWYNARYSFVFAFSAMYLALRSACLKDKIEYREIISAAGVILFLIVEIAVHRFSFIKMFHIVASVCLLAGYTMFLLCRKKTGRQLFSALLILFVCAEVYGNALMLAKGLDRQFEYQSRSEYKSFMQSYGNAVRAVLADDGGVYRTEILKPRSANTAMALGFNGISHYSTTTNQPLNSFLKGMGYNLGTINELNFSKSTPLTGGILGIKYVLAEQDMGDGYNPWGQIGEVGVYENLAAFPMAFWAKSSAMDFSYDGHANTFDMQNEMVKSLTGVDAGCFRKADHVVETLVNAEKKNMNGYVMYTRLIKNRDAGIYFVIDNPEKNDMYAYFPVYKNIFSRSEIYVNGKYHGRDFAYRANTIIPLGADEKIEVKIVMGGDVLRIEREDFVSLDINNAVNAAKVASQHALEYRQFKDTIVEGTINAPEKGIIATTFPNDEGWSIRVDGKPAKTGKIGDVFLGIEVDEGEHSISMRYLPPGFAAGALITLLTIASTALYWFIKARR